MVLFRPHFLYPVIVLCSERTFLPQDTLADVAPGITKVFRDTIAIS